MPSKIIQFPAANSSLVARSANARKRGARSLVAMKAPIDSNQPRLIEAVRLKIALMWRRGVSIALIAKMHQLTVAEAEAVIWMEYHPVDAQANALDRRNFRRAA